MDAVTFSKAMGGALPLSRYRELLPAFEKAMNQANLTTVDRVAMFVAQLGHESVGLKYMEEIWGPTAAQHGYEGRRDLGNTQPGDGQRFKGHGPIQITGRHNHTKVSQWAGKHGYTKSDDYFVRHPAELGSDKYGFLGAVWYWTVARNINHYADAGDIVGATKAVNGGTNGLADRTRRWNAARTLGTKLLPKGVDPHPPKTPAVLREGSSGAEVKKLQRFMNEHYPAYSKLVVDGEFGGRTASVVREFQRRSKLRADGVVGSSTWWALRAAGYR